MLNKAAVVRVAAIIERDIQIQCWVKLWLQMHSHIFLMIAEGGVKRSSRVSQAALQLALPQTRVAETYRWVLV